MLTYGVIFPVYNEEKRLENGINRAYSYIKDLGIRFVILVVDNGSTDCTREIAEGLCRKYPEVNYLRLEEKGVGIAFKSGVSIIDTDIVGYIDIDLAVDICYLSTVVSCFENNPNVDIVNTSRFNRQSVTHGRKWYRNIMSYGLLIILKVFLGMKASDALCGFKFFKKKVVDKLLRESADEKGWFLIIEMLVRAERNNARIVELPVEYYDDADNSKVKIVDTIIDYLKHIKRLRNSFEKF